MSRTPNTSLVGLAFLGFIAMGLNAGLMGVVWPSIRTAFGLSLDAIGTLMLLSMLASLVVSFNSGGIIAKMGLGPVLIIGFALGGLGFLGVGLAPSWWAMILAGMVSSIGSTAINTGLNIFFATHVGAGLMNWLHACFGLGAIISPVIMTALLDRGYSWRWGYGLIALPYGLLAVCFGATLQGWSLTKQTSAHATPTRPTQIRSRDALRRSSVWLSLALFFTFTGMEGSAGQWPYTLFTEARSVDAATAGLWVSVFWGSMTVGRMFFGIVADRIEAVPLIRMCMGGTVCGAAFIWWNISDTLSFLGLALIGFSGSPFFPVLTSNTPERLGAEHAVNAIGFQITAVKLGLAAIPALVGVLAEAFGLELIGPSLFVIAIAMLLLYEATVPRKTPSK